MFDHNLARAQASYDAQEPKEPSGRCECGHDYEDHADPIDSPERNALIELTDCFKNSWTGIYELSEAIRKARETLAVCQVQNCDCRHFEPATEDPNLSQEEE